MTVAMARQQKQVKNTWNIMEINTIYMKDADIRKRDTTTTCKNTSRRESFISISWNETFGLQVVNQKVMNKDSPTKTHKKICNDK